MRLHPAWLSAIAFLAGCGSGATGPGEDGGGPSADAGADAGAGYAYDLPGVTYTVDAGAPITAPEETWTYVPLADAFCANGTTTGVGVNLTTRSRRVVVFFAGGGACWEAAACAAGTAVHIQDTVGESTVLSEAQAQDLSVIFDRGNAQNPFRDANFVYVPYCTGDLHAGTQTYTYDWFGPRPLMHVGARNVDALLRRLQPTFRDADRVWLAGVSAGGYGATFHWWRFQKAMPWARVDVLSDSGIVIDTAGDGRYGTMVNHWAPEFPPGCSACANGLGAVLTYSQQLLPAPRRYGLLAYTQDSTIGTYFGLDAAQMESALTALRAGAMPGVKTFYVSGTSHVVLSTPDVAAGGVTARAFVQAMVGDDPLWANAGP